MVLPHPISGNGPPRVSESALVTGAASGIGREFAFALAGRGENVLLLDRAREPLDQRFVYCGALRARFKPYFLRSLALGSRVRRPASRSAARKSG